MSRSRKKNPVTTYCAHTQKMDKCRCNRSFRKLERQNLHVGRALPMKTIEIQDTWYFVGDGKRRWTPDDDLYEKIMRK